MSDKDKTEETVGDADRPVSDDSSRRPSPNPASRARRIGGRPTPRRGPQPTPGTMTSTASTEKAVSTDKPVSTRKPVSTAKPAPEVATPPAPGSTEEPVGRTETAETARSRRGLPLRWIPAGVLGLAVVTLAVLLVIASHGVYWAKPDNSQSARTARQEQVLASAKKCFALINTYDYRKLDGLVAKDTVCTTGKFTSDLTKALQTQIIPLAPKLKATQTAQVNKAGIASVSPDGSQVVTLLYGQLAQSNSTTAKTTPRVDVVGAVVTLDKVGDRWLISKVDTDVGNAIGS